jgi:hypothetical protein
VGAAAIVELQLAMLRLVAGWHPPRLRLALTAVVTGTPVSIALWALDPMPAPTVAIIGAAALVLQAA